MLRGILTLVQWGGAAIEAVVPKEHSLTLQPLKKDQPHRWCRGEGCAIGPTTPPMFGEGRVVHDRGKKRSIPKKRRVSTAIHSRDPSVLLGGKSFRPEDRLFHPWEQTRMCAWPFSAKGSGWMAACRRFPSLAWSSQFMGTARGRLGGARRKPKVKHASTA